MSQVLASQELAFCKLVWSGRFIFSVLTSIEHFLYSLVKSLLHRWTIGCCFFPVMLDLLIIPLSLCSCTNAELLGLGPYTLPAVQHMLHIFIGTVEITWFLSIHFCAWQQFLHGYSCCFPSLLNVLALAVSVPSPAICLAGSLSLQLSCSD